MGCFKRESIRFVFCAGFLSVFLLSVFLAGCFAPSGGAGLGLSQDNDDRYERSDRQDRNSRERGSSREREREEECEGDDDCEEICRKIYRRTTVRDECLELSTDQVGGLDEIYKALKNPHSDELDDIDSEDLQTFVNIDLKPLNTLVGEFSSTEGKKVLAWIAQNSDIAEVFRNADREYALLEELLDSLDNNAEQEALSRIIDGGESFMELAIADGGAALDWAHNFIVEECDGDTKGEEVCVLQDWYCETISSNNERIWSDLVRYSNFAGVANEILDRYTAGSSLSWWTDEVRAEGVDELRDKEDLADLCPPATLTEN